MGVIGVAHGVAVQSASQYAAYAWGLACVSPTRASIDIIISYTLEVFQRFV